MVLPSFMKGANQSKTIEDIHTLKKRTPTPGLKKFGRLFLRVITSLIK